MRRFYCYVTCESNFIQKAWLTAHRLHYNDFQQNNKIQENRFIPYFPEMIFVSCISAEQMVHTEK